MTPRSHFRDMDSICTMGLSCFVQQDPTAIVIDHSRYAISENEGDHRMIASDNLIKSDVMVLGSSKIDARISFGFSSFSCSVPYLFLL
ncbi:hypothetical protein SAY87_024718 [Trapa incisa]|uniref:Uncharacterized protein n=1 Tax=Trapa incisa TaxID=236973 RepID=A0AAN7JFZ6_9MYRT|nr:hypothetical protein SAY87_024718 [Trapa incisa]